MYQLSFCELGLKLAVIRSEQKRDKHPNERPNKQPNEQQPDFSAISAFSLTGLDFSWAGLVCSWAGLGWAAAGLGWAAAGLGWAELSNYRHSLWILNFRIRNLIIAELSPD